MEYTYDMFIAELTNLGISLTEARRRTTSPYWNRKKKVAKQPELV